MTDSRRTTSSDRLGARDWTLLELPMLSRMTMIIALGLGVCGPSCLATSVVDFPAVQQTPPHLRANLAVPALDQLVVIHDETSPKVQFVAVVESEDANNSLEARLIADDIFAQPPNVLARTVIEPGKAGQERSFSLTYDPSTVSLTNQTLSRGCHPLTLVVSPSYNFLSDQPSDPALEDLIVWWALKGDSKTPSYLDSLPALACPNPAGGAVSP